MRECREEAGCDIQLTGVLRIERSIRHDHARMRAIYSGQPINADIPLKCVADRESESARWVDMAELHKIANCINPWGVLIPSD